jgi:hypothetical protein
MERKDWTLLVISAAGTRGLSPVQLQKCLFLIGKNLPDEVGESFYDFVPYNYGPFDQAIYADADTLVNEKLVAIARVAGKTWAYYVITPEGTAAAERITITLKPRVRDYIPKVVQWVQQLSFVQLLTAIYQKYPEYQANSVFLRR